MLAVQRPIAAIASKISGFRRNIIEMLRFTGTQAALVYNSVSHPGCYKLVNRDDL
jgi:hypothetical protein